MTTQELRGEERHFFERAFENMDSPPDIRAIAIRICRAYGINGICDPAYIANIIAKETGRGDGQGRFFQQKA